MVWGRQLIVGYLDPWGFPPLSSVVAGRGGLLLIGMRDLPQSQEAQMKSPK